MNIPNQLTVLRVLIIPFMVVLYYVDPEKTVLNGWSIAIGGLFIFGAITDFLDGYLARKYELITVFGKFLDPLADKLLVMFALLMLLDMNWVPMWIVLTILTREFVVTGIRLIAVDSGKVIAASLLGKYKTAITMIALILLIFHVQDIGLITLYIATALTIISGFEYIIKNQHSFKDAS